MDSQEQQIGILQRTILPLFATFGFPYCDPIGTAFIVYREDKIAIGITAAHNFQEIAKLDERHKIGRTFTPPEYKPRVVEIKFERTSPRVLYPDNMGNVRFLPIRHAYVLSPSDVAIFTVVIPSTCPSELVFTNALKLDTGPPPKGTRVKALGYERMTYAPPESGTININCTLAKREGVVTEVYPYIGPRNKLWPCFEASIPFDGGMSGGPVFDCSGSEDIVVGAISSDFSLGASDAGSGFGAICSILWPAMTIPMTHDVIQGIHKPSLIELEKRCLVYDRGLAHKHVHCSDNAGQVILNWV